MPAHITSTAEEAAKAAKIKTGMGDIEWTDRPASWPAQQALELLRKSVGAMRGLYGGWRCEAPLRAADAAIHALEAALEQPDQSKGEHMTRDDIIRMAREAGLAPIYSACDEYAYEDWDEELERFAAIVAAAEREACAKVAETTVCDTHLPTGVQIYGSKAAAAIRARGNK
jgi:hypothetical protein